MNKNHMTYWVLGLLFLALGVGLRLHLLVDTGWNIDSDEAIVGLMARHINEGRSPVPTFYYGQAYMGTLEPLTASFVFKLFGASSVALKLVPLLFYVALFPVVFWLGALIGGAEVGLATCWLTAVSPASFVEWSTRARGGFIEVVLFCTLALALVLKWLKFRPHLVGTACIGLLLGLSWWTNNQTVFVLGPIGLFMLLGVIAHSKDSWRSPFHELKNHFIVGSVCFLLGGFPFWRYNILNDFASFKMFSTTSNILQNFDGFWSVALPVLVGAKRAWEGVDIFPGATWVAAIIFGVTLVWLILDRIILAEESIEERGSRAVAEKGASLLLLFVVTASAIFVLSSFGALFTAPRYLLPIYPAIFVLVAITYQGLKSANWFCGVGYLAAVSVLFLASNYYGGHYLPGEPFVYERERVAADHRELNEWLLSRGIKRIATNYWIGYRVAFETQEQVTFSQIGEPYQVRIPEYEHDGPYHVDQKLPLVLTPHQGEQVSRALTKMGYTFQSTSLSGYTVLSEIVPVASDKTVLSPQDFTIAASTNLEEISKLTDGSLATRWGTAQHQQPGQYLKFQLNDTKPMVGVRLDLGGWSQDYPRGLKVSCERVGGEKIELLSTADISQGLRILREPPLWFGPQLCEYLMIEQQGEHPIFDWSVAELSLYQPSKE